MKTEELITAFKQGGAGNCVSVAAIKAAIEVFGLGNVFVADSQVDGGLTITMRDGISIVLTVTELEYAKENSRFIMLDSQQVFEYATLCYAAMAKRVQQDEKEEKLSYAEAVADLNDGASYLQGPNWLGLRHHVRAVGLKFIRQYDGVIGASSKHCFFASHKLADDYGRVDPIQWLEIKYKFYHYVRLDPTPMY
ncbi:MAG: hypothetical protein EOO60_07680 [Hymenobacter sp.]|nr:MAG: hypothetical protein EOO60_07680 [Hymenobacter sp.]